MKNYQIALIYDLYHDEKAIRLINRLQDAGIDVLICTQLTAAAELEQNVKKAEFLFALLVDDAPFPRPLTQITEQLLEQIGNRGKQLYVIKEHRAPLPPDFQGYPVLEPTDGTMTSPNGGGIAGMICNMVVSAENKQVLYEKLNALMAISYRPGIQETLCALCELLCRELLEAAPRQESDRESLAELLRIFEQLDQYGTGYGKEQKAIAYKMLNAISHTGQLSRKFADSRDLFCLACLLRMQELSHMIRASCVDTTTTGDIDLYAKPLPEDYHLQARRFLSLLETGDRSGYTPQQLFVITDQAGRSQKLLAAENEGTVSTLSIIVQKSEKEEESAPLSETERKLHDIAEFMSKGYSLFETMAQDKTASDFLRCLKTSFERLKNYCDIIEAKAISAQCIGYIARIDQQLGRMEDTGDAQDKAGLGLKALLGLKLPSSGQYDVFLSYKHEDEDIARQVYHFLKSKLLNAFFDKISLPELSDSDYDEAIMNALDHSHHFLVIITDLAQLQTYWIKLEMKTFRLEISEGRKPDANFIILVTDQVFEQIRDSNKTVLPLRYRSCEIMRIRDYKNSIYGYFAK